MLFKEGYLPLSDKIERQIKDCRTFEEQIKIISQLSQMNLKKTVANEPFVSNLNKSKMDFTVTRSIRYLKTNEKPTENPTLHRHNYIEMIYVYKGQSTQIINGERVVLKTGDMCILDTNTLHGEGSYLDDEIVYFCMSPVMFKSIYDECLHDNNVLKEFLKHITFNEKKTNQYLVFRAKEQAELKNIIEHIVEEFFEQKDGNQIIIKGYIIRLMSLLIKDAIYNLKKSINENSESEIFKKINHYVIEKKGNVSRSGLATLFYFSENHIYRIIKKQTGMGFMDYILNIRFQNAVKLLEETNLTVDEIIFQVGYANKNYFYKTFHAKFGMTPKKFRDEKMITS